jgi:hypothetical protein
MVYRTVTPCLPDRPVLAGGALVGKVAFPFRREGCPRDARRAPRFPGTGTGRPAATPGDASLARNATGWRENASGVERLRVSFGPDCALGGAKRRRFLRTKHEPCAPRSGFRFRTRKGIDVRTRTSWYRLVPVTPASSDRVPPGAVVRCRPRGPGPLIASRPARSRVPVSAPVRPIRAARPPSPRKKNQAARGRGSASATWTVTSKARSISRMAEGGGRSVNRSSTSRIEPSRTMAPRPNLV